MFVSFYSLESTETRLSKVTSTQNFLNSHHKITDTTGHSRTPRKSDFFEHRDRDDIQGKHSGKSHKQSHTVTDS